MPRKLEQGMRPINQTAADVFYGWNRDDETLDIPPGYLPCPRCTRAFRLRSELQDHCEDAHPTVLKTGYAAFAMGEERAIGFELIDLSDIPVSPEQKSRFYRECNDHDLLDLCRDSCAKYGEGTDDSGKPYFLYFCGSRQRFLHELHCAVHQMFSQYYPRLK